VIALLFLAFVAFSAGLFCGVAVHVWTGCAREVDGCDEFARMRAALRPEKP
jgi:hypothetical protein